MELFLGSSLLCVLLSHQAELLVPPRGSRGHSRLWGQAKAPWWPWGKLLIHPYSEQLMCFTSPLFPIQKDYFECKVYIPADKLTQLP